jgi:alpha-mannosidase
MRAEQTNLHTGILPSQASFLEVEPPEFIVSAIKTANDGTGMLVRGYNSSSEGINVYLKPWRSFSSVIKTNLSEEGEEILEQDVAGGIHLQLRAHEIVTLKFCTRVPGSYLTLSGI